jgi:SAM-dependent methyltransferase
MGPLDAAQSASQSQFDRQSRHYGGNHILADTSDLASTLPLLRPQPGQHLLDVATGAGHTALFFAKLGLHVTAADLSPRMLEQTRAAAAQAGLTLDTRQHTAEELPYPAAAFDFVTCRVAAHHFSCPASFVMESARVLKPGGHLLVIDGTVEDGHPAAEEWLHQVEKLRDPSHHRFLRPLQWTHLCGHAGLRVLHSRIQTRLQPDLEWYFSAAATPGDNRRQVLDLVARAPGDARQLFQLSTADNHTTWWWQILVLAAVKLD